MDNATRDGLGIAKLHNDSDAPTNLNAHGRTMNSKTNETAEPTIQRRTRSQLNVPDLILHLPLAHSPLKDAQRARAGAQGMSSSAQTQSHPWSSGYSQSRTQGGLGAESGPSVVIEAEAQRAVYEAEEEEERMDMSAERAQRREEEQEEDETEDEMLSPGKSRNQDLDSMREGQTAAQATSTKKRASPDTDPAYHLANPGGERQPKRAKVEALRLLGRRRKEHSEYDEPLRDPDASHPHRSKGYVRAASTKPKPSPSKIASSSIFPQRARSVPLEGGESEVRAIDLLAIPPSPQRSSSGKLVEIRRAPSLPPPDADVMNVESGEAFCLIHSTNVSVPTPRAKSAFNYTVNFAAPRGFTTPATRSGYPITTPMSPLTPLPPTPFVDRLPAMQTLLLKRAKSSLNTLIEAMDADADIPTSPIHIPLTAQKTSSSIDTVTTIPSITYVPPRPSLVASTSRPASVASGSFTTSQSRLPRSSANPSSGSMVLTPPPPVPEKSKGRARAATVSETSGQKSFGSPTSSEGAENISVTAPTGLSPNTNTTALNSRLEPKAAPTAPPNTRPSVISAMRPKREPSIPPGPRRVTRSVSMKEQRVKGEGHEDDETVAAGESESGVSRASSFTAPGPSTAPRAILPPSATVTSKHERPKSTATSTSKLKLPSVAQRPTPSMSTLKPPPDASKLKQSSLNVFVKAKPSTAIVASSNDSVFSTSTSSGTWSKVAPPPSPSKIKRPSTTQTLRKPKPISFSFGSTKSGSRTGGSSGTSAGHSLTTLSHALEKLVVPPPSRPNTSMGFVRAEGAGQGDEGEGAEEGHGGQEKGKRKAKDDASLPSTSTAQGSGTMFARPTASSLKRAATVTGSGSTFVARMRGRSGAAAVAVGRGRGTIGIFGKTGERASKKTSLPSVMGSPVKSLGAEGDDERNEWGDGKSRLSLCGTKDGPYGMLEGVGGSVSQGAAVTGGVDEDVVMQDVSVEAPVSGSRSREPSPSAKSTTEVDIDLSTSPISPADKGKQRAAAPSTLNLASSALHALSESLSSLPQTPTPPKPRVAGTRTGLRSASVAFGQVNQAGDGSSSTRPGGSSEVNGSGGDVDGLTSVNANGTVNGSGGTKKSSLKVLKRCAIFVDVRTEQGDDAGSLFVDMLRGLGAKIMGRIGQSCTHIVYKNGLPNTLTRYRMLNDPKPFVVGIAWVVECVEQRTRVDEERFKVDVDMINVAGGNKRRRSMLPKHLIPLSPAAGAEISFVPANMSSEADEDSDDRGIDGPSPQDLDTSIRSRDEDELPPLERARRRKSVLPGGQTRLVP